MRCRWSRTVLHPSQGIVCAVFESLIAHGIADRGQSPEQSTAARAIHEDTLGGVGLE